MSGEIKIPIPGRLKNVAVGGHVAGVEDIVDDSLNKTQAEINEEVDSTLKGHGSAIEGLNSQNYESYEATDQTTRVTDVLPPDGALDTVYRLGNWNGYQYDITTYSEYAWNGSTYVLLSIKDYGIDNEPIAGSGNLVTSGGVYKEIKGFVIPDGNVAYPYTLEIGKAYIIKNTSQIEDINLFGYTSNPEPILIVSNIGVGKQIKFVSSYNCVSVKISSEAGASALLMNVTDDVIGKTVNLEDNVDKIDKVLNEAEAVQTTIKGGLTNYNITEDIEYIVTNTGSAAVSVYLSNPYVVVIDNVAIGDAKTFIAPRSDVQIGISNVLGAKALISKKDSVTGRLKNIEIETNKTKAEAENITTELFAKSLNKGNNSYTLKQGRLYYFENIGTVNDISVAYRDSVDTAKYIIRNFALNNTYAFIPTEDSSVIFVSNVNGAKVSIVDSSLLCGESYPIKKSKIICSGGSNEYVFVEGHQYTIKNTGTVDSINVSYKVSELDSSVRIFTGLKIGEEFNFIPPENAWYVVLSSVPGAKITITTEIGGDMPMQVNSILNEPIRIRVATWNTGDYTGRELTSEQAIYAYRKLTGELGADIIGTQEDIANFGGEDIAETFWKMYKYYNRRGTQNLNYKAFASNHPIYNIRQINYTGDYEFRHTYFLAGDLFIRGKHILVLSFHFDWSDNDTRQSQIEQTITYAEDYDNVIMMGDTNCANYIDGVPQEPRNLYNIEWPIFSEAGYEMANDGYFGAFPTVGYDYDDVSRRSPLDNIFVRGTITINNADIIVKEWTNDHCILYADLSLG